MKALLLASSGGKSEYSASKQIQKLSWDETFDINTKSPLSGVNIDIQHFKQMFKQPTILETSKEKKKLLSSKYIKQKINKHINQEGWDYDVNLFYFTGHAYYNGDLLIQTIQNPDGERLTIQQILELYMSHQDGYHGDCFLYIYLDCCYAGKNIVRAQKWMEKHKSRGLIHIICSSGINHTSIDLHRFGGLLICRQWAVRMKNYLSQKQKKQISKLFQSKEPISVLFWDGKVESKIQMKWYLRSSHDIS